MPDVCACVHVRRGRSIAEREGGTCGATPVKPMGTLDVVTRICSAYSRDMYMNVCLIFSPMLRRLSKLSNPVPVHD